MTLCVCWTTLWRRLILASSSLPLPSGTVNTPSTSRKSTFMAKLLPAGDTDDLESCYISVLLGNGRGNTMRGMMRSQS